MGRTIVELSRKQLPPSKAFILVAPRKSKFHRANICYDESPVSADEVFQFAFTPIAPAMVVVTKPSSCLKNKQQL